jgi:alpha/beta superfamily hydrolase
LTSLVITTKIRFDSQGYALAGNLYMASQPKRQAFLFIQGWQGSQNAQTAQKLADLGYTCMTYDMHGNKDSEGTLEEFSRSQFVMDAATAYDYLKSQIPLDTEIGIIGSSFGSYTAVLLTGVRNVVSLSLRVPANYPDAGFDENQAIQKYESDDFTHWRQQPHTYTDNRALHALHNFTGAVHIVRAECDDMVPEQVPKDYAAAVSNASKLTYDLMKDAPHRLLNERLRQEYDDLLTAWLEKTFSAF